MHLVQDLNEGEVVGDMVLIKTICSIFVCRISVNFTVISNSHNCRYWANKNPRVPHGVQKLNA